MGEEIANNSQQQVHMSADDLNDGFVLDNDDKKTLAYQVGWKSQILSEINSVHASASGVFLYPGWKMEH